MKLFRLISPPRARHNRSAWLGLRVSGLLAVWLACGSWSANAQSGDSNCTAIEASTALERQFRILKALNRFANQEALQAMLRCVTQAEASRQAELPKHAGHTLREWTVRFLTDQDNYQTGEKWHRVLESFPKANLQATQRELLDQAAAFRPQPNKDYIP